MSDYQQYDHPIVLNDQQEPIITFENRQPASSQRTTTKGEENQMQNTGSMAGPILSSEEDMDTARSSNN